MQDKLTKIFQGAKYGSEINLDKKIWNTIIAREKRNVQIKFWTFSLAGIVSMTGLVPVCKMLLGELAQSGFYEYFSLIFSDTGSAFYYWKELSFSLIESLPIMSMIFTLTLLFTIFLSMKYIVKQIINNNSMGKTYRIA